MAERSTESIRVLEFDFTASPSGGDLSVFAKEERFTAYALLYGYTPSLRAINRTECVAMFMIRGLVQLVYGYPNEDAYWNDPRGGLDSGVSEIVGSRWLDSINSYNNKSYGSDYDTPGSPLRHFFIGSKDSSAQFLARSIDVELFMASTDGAFELARTEALRRLDAPEH